MPNADIVHLAEAVNALRDGVGEVGTDASALERPGARQFLELVRAGEANPAPRLPDVVAIMDSPSGYSQRRLIALLGAPVTPVRFDAARRLELARHVNTILDYELPIVLHRWAFDQVIDDWLGDMQLSATAVISVQRSLLVVRGNLMVRVGKVISDPRAQMVSLREQTVLNPEQDDNSRLVLPRHPSHHLNSRG